MALLDTTLWHNTMRQWLSAVALAMAILLILALALRLVRGRLRAIAGRTATYVDDLTLGALARTTRLFVLVVAVRAGATLLSLPAQAESLLKDVAEIVLLFQIGVWATALVTGGIEHYANVKHKDDRGARTTLGAVSFALKLVLWSVVLLMALENFGVNITTFITGLGVGGVAVALAVQNILGDLFASLSIVLDKPFVIGDFLIVGEFQGSVEHVGLKTTRLRSLGGEQLIFSNGELTKSRMRNYGRMAERRVVFKIGVTYDTPREKLAQIPGWIKQIVAEQPQTRVDRSHFAAYGDFALTFETVYYVLSPDYNTYMDIQQTINLKIHERFEKEGIEFAFPTQTLILERASKS